MSYDFKIIIENIISYDIIFLSKKYTMKNIVLLFILVLGLTNAKTYNYTILYKKEMYNYNVKDFSYEVTSFLNNGWELAGNLVVSRSSSYNTIFYQPIKKEFIQDNYLEPF